MNIALFHIQMKTSADFGVCNTTVTNLKFI